MTNTVITLIAQAVTTDENGFETRTETTKDVFAEATSVTGREFYNALAAGVQTDVMFRTRTVNYAAQPEIEWRGMRYRVVRAFDRADDWTEITAAVMREVVPDGDDRLP